VRIEKPTDKRTESNADITGVILAGGRGTRMGGVDKGLQPFRGASMVKHVISRLAPQTGKLMIVANQNLPLYQRFGVPVWPDALPDFPGPLAGLQTGLMHCDTRYLVTAPCDSPFLPSDLVARLFDGLTAQEADLALAVTGDAASPQSHPVFCLLKTALLPQVTAFLQRGGRRMDAWYQDGRNAQATPLKAVQVHFADEAAFRNINTRQDLQTFDVMHDDNLR
jgi:molybdopterin-guanine dinucleotide biosynthesis protein A